MNRTVVLACAFIFAVVLARRVGGRRGLYGSEIDVGLLKGGFAFCRIEFVGAVIGLRFVRRGWRGSHRPRASVFKDFLGQHASLLAAGCRGLPLLVLVLGVARGAPRLPDVVLNHRDNHMVGEAALARAVIVQNVTEPKPALLHELPRKTGPFGWE